MMSYEARKHYDSEARKRLKEQITDEAVLKEIEKAYDDNLNAVERQEVEMWERYASIPQLLAQTSAVSGTSQERLLIITRRIAVTSKDVEWYQVLSTINAYYRIKSTLEKDEESNKEK